MLAKCPVTATLPYRGLATAEDFYVRKLGLKRAGGSIADGYLEFEAGGGTTFSVFESDSRKSDDTAANFEVENLDKEMEELRAKGVVFEEYDLPEVKTVRGVATMDGHRAAWIKDPSGNVLCLHQEA
jgi:catechol 2,3-dioxygenase-like lactoylglutathione lyase family enzyme